MYCNECGAKNEVDVRYCDECGAQIRQTPPRHGGRPPAGRAADKAGVLDLGGVVRIDAYREDEANITIAGVRLQAGLIFKVIAPLLIFVLILPFFSIGVNIFGISMHSTMNGFRTAFSSDGTFSAIFLILIPIALFALFRFKRAIPFAQGRLFMISTGLSTLGFIMLFIVRGSLRSSVQPVGFASGSGGFVISVIIYIVAMAVSAGFLLATMKK